jgi:hypothetical protein
MGNVKGKLRQHLWASGPDPLVHRKYFPWHCARSQAHYRGEKYFISFEEFCEMWTDDLWERRGRKSDELAMIRLDPRLPWSIGNCAIVTRKEQLGKDNRARRGKKYKTKSKEDDNGTPSKVKKTAQTSNP